MKPPATRYVCFAALVVLPVLATAPAGPAPGGTAKLQDLHGDPLPPGALARLGTTRFRVGDGVQALAFSPDGKSLASGSRDHTVRVWDASTGKESQRLPDHNDFVTAVAYTPDGNVLASAADDGTIRLSHPKTGQVLHRFKGPYRAVACLVFSPDGALLVTGGWAGDRGETNLHVWEARTGKLLRELEHKGQVCTVAFAADGRTFASGGADGLVRLWETATFRLRAQFRTHGEDAGVASLAFAADGRTLAVAGDQHGRDVVLWDTVTSKVLRRLDGRTPLAFTPDGKLLATAARDFGVCLWDYVTGKEVRRLGPAVRGVTALAFTRDRKMLAAAARRAINLWRVADGQELHTTAAHHDAVAAVAFSPDGKQVATGSSDGTARLWDAGTGKHVRLLANQLGADPALAFAGPGQLLVTAGPGWRLIDLATGKETKRIDTGVNTRVECLSGDGQTAVVEGPDAITLRATATGKEIARLAIRLPGHVLAISHDGKTLVYWERDEKSSGVRVWDVAGKQGPRTLDVKGDKEEAFVYGVTFDRGGKTLALVHGRFHVVSLWDLAAGKEILRLPRPADVILAVALSPDGALVAHGSLDNSVRIFDTATGKETAHLVGHHGHVEAMAFSPDGKRLASASTDSTVLVWDVGG
jgi:WD40 repeat protein